jgi:sensor histidine kinase regulating citrate/malate metabolism
MYYVFTAIFHITLEDLGQQTGYRLALLITAHIALTVILYLLSIKKARHHPQDIIPLLLFVVINIAVIGIIDSLYLLRERYGLTTNAFTLPSALTVLISLVSIVLYEIMSNHIINELKYKQEAETIANRERNLEMVQVYHKSIDHVMHDFKSHLQAAYDLIYSGKIEESTRYLKEIELNTPLRYITGHDLIDYIINMKAARMRENNISFELEAGPLQEVPIPEYDLLTILINLLDNAMEAVERSGLAQDERKIALSVARVRNMLLIDCVNPARPAHIKRRGKRFVSAKQGAHHGYGIENVRQIVEEAGGHSVFQFEEGRFIVQIALPYPLKKK